MAEEAFLHQKFGEEYDVWAKNTPAFIPRFSQWKANDMTFSWKMILRREYPGLLVIASGFLLLNWVQEHLVEGEPMDMSLEYVFTISLLLALVLRTLKKKTSLLKVEQR